MIALADPGLLKQEGLRLGEHRSPVVDTELAARDHALNDFGFRSDVIIRAFEINCRLGIFAVDEGIDWDQAEIARITHGVA